MLEVYSGGVQLKCGNLKIFMCRDCVQNFDCYKFMTQFQSNFLHVIWVDKNPPTLANRSPTPGISPKRVNVLIDQFSLFCARWSRGSEEGAKGLRESEKGNVPSTIFRLKVSVDTAAAWYTSNMATVTVVDRTTSLSPRVLGELVLKVGEIENSAVQAPAVYVYRDEMSVELWRAWLLWQSSGLTV